MATRTGADLQTGAHVKTKIHPMELVIAPWFKKLDDRLRLHSLAREISLSTFGFRCIRCDVKDKGRDTDKSLAIEGSVGEK